MSPDRKLVTAIPLKLCHFPLPAYASAYHLPVAPRPLAANFIDYKPSRLRYFLSQMRAFLSYFRNQFTLSAVLLLLSLPATAQQLSVTSSTDGNGLFTYTFGSSSTSLIWGAQTNQGILLPSFGILEISTPPDWTYSIQNETTIYFVPKSGLVYIGEPEVTFTVRSSSTSAVTYTNTTYFSDYSRGLIVGNVYTLPDHNILAGGYESFSFLGPEAIPEPTTLLFAAAALLLIGWRGRQGIR
jgi:hypothetical protein